MPFKARTNLNNNKPSHEKVFVKNEKRVDEDYFHLPKEEMTEFELKDQFMFGKDNSKKVDKVNYLHSNKNLGKTFDDDKYQKQHNTIYTGAAFNTGKHHS